uniref:Ig-like domain-containing protein n=1 Tax=Naja naja TaxID=35670 RepID=A0A8C6XME2_NAJNA
MDILRVSLLSLFHCVPTSGVPEAELTWFRNKIKMPPDLHIHDGSLLIPNVSISDQGLYSCRAANIRGEVTESTQLLVLDPPQLPHQFEDMAATLSLVGPGIPSVITSPSGTRKILSQGSSVLIGCPVDGHPTPNITWFYDGHPFHLPHQVLASGQILQILNVSNDYLGEISCRAQNEAGLLIQKTSLVIQGKTYFESSLTQPVIFPCAFKHSELLDRCLWCTLESQSVDVVHCYLRMCTAGSAL